MRRRDGVCHSFLAGIGFHLRLDAVALAVDVGRTVDDETDFASDCICNPTSEI